MSAKIIQPVCPDDRSFTILDARAPHFGHPATSFWTTGLYNSFMGLMGPIGLIGLIGVLDFSPVRFVRSVRCGPPFWTPFSLILDTLSAYFFMGLMGPIGPMGLMGVLDFSPVRFVRRVRILDILDCQ